MEEKKPLIQVCRAIICRPDITTIVGTDFLKEMQVLILKRGGTGCWRDRWECPGGKLEGDEDVRAALYREVFQETGLKIKTDILVEVGKYTGEPYNKLEEFIPNPDPVDYEVTYYLVSAEDGMVQLSDEHVSAEWDLPTKIVTDIRDCVRPCTRNAVVHGVFTTLPSLIRERQLPLLQR